MELTQRHKLLFNNTLSVLSGTFGTFGTVFRVFWDFACFINSLTCFLSPILSQIVPNRVHFIPISSKSDLFFPDYIHWIFQFSEIYNEFFDSKINLYFSILSKSIKKYF